MRLVFASQNRDKIAELRDALAGLPLEIQSAGDYPEIPAIEETGQTLRENALLKARVVYDHTGLLCLADDTGLEVDQLDGAPGIKSARFAGPEQSYERNVQKLLDVLAGTPEDRRTAQFRTVVALLFPDGSDAVVEGTCAGVILKERRGVGGFGYDPVFYVPDAGKTFAEMELAEKQRLSHRGRAMRKARSILQEWLSYQGV